MKTYIGCKIIQGEPMQEHEYALGEFGKGTKDTVEIDSKGNSRDGYHVIYPDGYHSWSPKFAFENAYREIIQGEFELLNPPKQVA